MEVLQKDLAIYLSLAWEETEYKRQLKEWLFNGIPFYGYKNKTHFVNRSFSHDDPIHQQEIENLQTLSKILGRIGICQVVIAPIGLDVEKQEKVSKELLIAELVGCSFLEVAVPIENSSNLSCGYNKRLKAVWQQDSIRSKTYLLGGLATYMGPSFSA